MSKPSELREEISNLVARTSEQTGIEVLKSAFIMEHQRRILRITITSPDGVSLDMCETFSRALSDMLDREDVIKDKYYLEVESPGI